MRKYRNSDGRRKHNINTKRNFKGETKSACVLKIRKVIHTEGNEGTIRKALKGRRDIEGRKILKAGGHQRQEDIEGGRALKAGRLEGRNILKAGGH